MAVPRDPGASELYLRLLGDTEGGVRMALGKPPLFSETITKIRRWIESGAPDWNAFPKLEVFRTRCTLCLYLIPFLNNRFSLTRNRFVVAQFIVPLTSGSA